MNVTTETKPVNATIETDARFAGGPWKGFFLQPSQRFGRAWMQLSLRFAGGLVEGEGKDFVGEFSFRGRYELLSGRVTMLKRYSTHCVDYAGWAEEDKGIYGVWTIREAAGRVTDKGGFHIWPRGIPDPTGDGLRYEADVPVEGETGPTRSILPGAGEFQHDTARGSASA